MGALGLKRNRSAGAVISPSVRTTTAHTRRAERAFHVLDHGREEGVLEHARFENGMYEGRWRDPLLDTKGQIPEASVPAQYDWLERNIEELDSHQQMASRIL